MKHLVLFLLSLLLATTAVAKPRVSPNSTTDSYTVTVTFVDGDTAPSDPIPVGGQCIVSSWVRGGSETVTIYQTTGVSGTAPVTPGTSVTVLTTTTTAPVALTYGQPYLYAQSDGASGGGVLVIKCTNSQVSSNGGGVVGSGPLAEMLAYPNPQAGDIWQQTDDDATGDCASTGGTNSALLCQWNDGTSAWVPAGLAGATDNLGNHTATTDLDIAGNDILDVETIDIDGAVLYSPDAWTGSVSAGTDSGRWNNEVWITADGVKDTGSKSTIAGSLRRTYALTESENYGDLVRLYCGADSDCIGMFLMAWNSGGSQTAGDEGVQAVRLSAYDAYGMAAGNIDTAIASGAGTTTVTVSGISSSEARLVGENKLAVFDADSTAVDVDIVTLPAGVMNASGTVTDNTWSSTPSATQGVWILGSGEVTSSGVGVGWCFKADQSDFTSGWDSTANEAWLYITAVNAGTDAITTEWISQGIDMKNPYQYAAAIGTDTGRLAPCAKLGRPTLNASRETTSVPMTTGAGFPGIADTDTFEVHGYPGLTAQYGVTSRVGKMFGGPGTITSFALMGMNSMDFGVGRYQINALLDAQYSGSLSSMIDGNYHAFGYGMKCGTGDCEAGMLYNWLNDDNRGWPFELDAGATEFGTNDEAHIVMRVLDAGTSNAGNTSLNMTVDKTEGWGQNNDAFVTLARTQTITGTKTYTGTNDFTGGRIRVRDDATCSDNNLGGELCVQGPGSLFVEGVEVAGGGSGDVTAVGDCTTGACFTSSPGSETNLYSLSSLNIRLDTDGSATNFFNVFDADSGLVAWRVSEAGVMRMVHPDGTGAVYTQFTPNTSGAISYTLPNDDGEAGEQLQTNGSGALTWEPSVGDDSVTAAKIAAGAVDASELASTTVTPGSYTAADITVDADGRITAAASGGSSTITDAGTALVPIDAHDFIVGGNEDQTCESPEICLDEGTGVVTAEGLVIRDQASGSNYREFDDNPTTVPSAPSGDNVRLYTTDDGELYKKDADDGSGDGVRLMTAQDFRRYPFYFTDFLGPNNLQTGDPSLMIWDTTVVAAGTISGQAGTIDHPGWYNLLYSASGNSGVSINTNTNTFLPGGGETFEAIFQLVPASATGVNAKIGFIDTSATGLPNDGAFIYFDGSYTPSCVTVVGGTGETSTAFAAPITNATWYRAVVQFNADATAVSCSLFADGSDTPIETVTNSTEADIPNGAGQETGSGATFVHTGGSSTVLARIDWIAQYSTRRLNR